MNEVREKENILFVSEKYKTVSKRDRKTSKGRRTDWITAEDVASSFDLGETNPFLNNKEIGSFPGLG